MRFPTTPLLFVVFLFLAGCAAREPFFKNGKADWELYKPDPSLEPTYSMFLIGDAGKGPTDTIRPVFRLLKNNLEAAGKHSAVLFLGDNCYPQSLPSKKHPDRKRSEDYLTAQMDIVSDYKGDVVFIPGNHDWANGRQNGLERLNREEKFIEKGLDRGNVFLPDGGCPGPEEVELSDELVLILIDSQWWLHRNEKPDIEYDCTAKYNAEFISLLQDAILRHQDKKILIAAHHPLFSYGNHGGNFSWQNHIFPLTMAKKNLFIPLPVIGSLAPITRKLWGNIQDIPHPEYQELKDEILEVLEPFDNIIYAAGHDHNLQYIMHEGNHFLVSGAGSPSIRYVRKGKHARFAHMANGFMRLDIYANGEVWLEVWEPEGKGKRGNLVYREKLMTKAAPKEPESFSGLPAIDYRDSTILFSGVEDYKMKKGGRFWMGNNYREEWTQPLDIPVLDIWKEGYTIEKKGGGHQTRSLRLADSEGRHFVMRTIEKWPELAVPEFLRQTVVTDVFKDQITSSHPYAAFAIPPLADAAGVYHANPKLVYLPDDPRLGPYREEFGGRPFLFEERSAGDRTDVESFGSSERIISTLKLVNELAEDNDEDVDHHAILRARLFDLWLGDWDRHDDQWRWATFEQGDGRRIYKPVPRDRDQPFFKGDGFLHKLLMNKWALRAIQRFEEKLKDPAGVATSAKWFDRYFLNEPDYDLWMRTIDTLQLALTDEVIDEALKSFPPEIYRHSAAEIAHKLKVRRDDMKNWGTVYYRYLNRAVDVLGSDKHEYFEIERLNEEETRVTVYKRKRTGEREQILFQRTFKRSETHEIRLYGLDGEDVFQLKGSAPKGIKVRIIGGGDEDSIIDDSKVSGLFRKTLVYDTKDDTKIEKGPETRVRTSQNEEKINEYNRRSFQMNYTGPLVAFGFNRDDGIFIGGGVQNRTYGFRKKPYASFQKLTASFAFATNAFNFRYRGNFSQAIWGWDLGLAADFNRPNFVRNFFGLGNGTELDGMSDEDFDFNRVRINQGIYNASIARSGLNDNLHFYIGGRLEHSQVLLDDESSGRYIDTAVVDNGLTATDFEEKWYAGPWIGLSLDTRDSRINPTRGIHFNSRLGHNFHLNPGDGDKQGFSSFQSSLSLYFTAHIPFQTTLALRTGYGSNFGDDWQFFQAQTLGQNAGLIGYRKDRFAGKSSFYQNAELRMDLFKFKTFLFPGRFGLIGAYDLGRVWVDEAELNDPGIHQGWGAGIWIAPLELAVLQFAMTGSNESKLFVVTFGFRY
jgi:hypothetical protein